MGGPVDVSRSPVRGSLARAAGFLALWLMLFGLNPADLPVGALAAAVATWASLRLLPPGPWRLRPVALARLALRFLCQSIVAGADVARRALDPRLPLRPGFVTYPVGFPPGTGAQRLHHAHEPAARHGAGRETTTDSLVYHCLDVDQPVASQLAAEEAALSRALGHD